MWGGTQILVVRMALVHDTVHTSKIGKILHVIAMEFAFNNRVPGGRAHAAHLGVSTRPPGPAGAAALVQACKACECRLRMQGTGKGKRGDSFLTGK